MNRLSKTRSDETQLVTSQEYAYEHSQEMLKEEFEYEPPPPLSPPVMSTTSPISLTPPPVSSVTKMAASTPPISVNSSGSLSASTPPPQLRSPSPPPSPLPSPSINPNLPNPNTNANSNANPSQDNRSSNSSVERDDLRRSVKKPWMKLSASAPIMDHANPNGESLSSQNMLQPPHQFYFQPAPNDLGEKRPSLRGDEQLKKLALQNVMKRTFSDTEASVNAQNPDAEPPSPPANTPNVSTDLPHISRSQAPPHPLLSSFSFPLFLSLRAYTQRMGRSTNHLNLDLEAMHDHEWAQDGQDLEQELEQVDLGGDHEPNPMDGAEKSAKSTLKKQPRHVAFNESTLVRQPRGHSKVFSLVEPPPVNTPSDAKLFFILGWCFSPICWGIGSFWALRSKEQDKKWGRINFGFFVGTVIILIIVLSVVLSK